VISATLPCKRAVIVSLLEGRWLKLERREATGSLPLSERSGARSDRFTWVGTASRGPAWQGLRSAPSP